MNTPAVKLYWKQ